MIHITSATTTTVPPCAGIIVTVNAALTGTITISDSNGTQAIITNPGITQLPYMGFAAGNITIVTSATCDITISSLSRNNY